jgi:hypothetical protein
VNGQDPDWRAVGVALQRPAAADDERRVGVRAVRDFALPLAMAEQHGIGVGGHLRIVGLEDVVHDLADGLMT